MFPDPDDPNAVAEHVSGLPIRPESKVGMILDAMHRNLDTVQAKIPTLQRLAWRTAFCVAWMLVILTAAMIEPFVIRTEPSLSLIAWVLFVLLISFVVRFFYLVVKTARLYFHLKGRLR